MIYHCKLHGDTKTTINAKNICKDYFLPCKQCQSINKSAKAQQPRGDSDFYYKRLQEYCESRGGKVLSEEWITAKTKYKFKCDNPNHTIFTSSADALYSGSHWCPYCCGRRGNFEDEIKNIIENKDGILLSKYENSNKHVRVKCNKHDYIWDIMPLNIKKGRWCPVCNIPYSEQVVWDYLKDNNINVRVQYTFDDLFGEQGEKLKYDFAILDENNALIYIIEVDDSEHRCIPKDIKRIKARKRDIVKNTYCERNNINLYRMPVPYYRGSAWEYDDYYKYIQQHLSFLIKED